MMVRQQWGTQHAATRVPFASLSVARPYHICCALAKRTNARKTSARTTTD